MTEEQKEIGLSEAMDVVGYSMMIGQPVTKFKKGREPKPFKSGLKVNTVKGIIMHPQLGKPAFTFVEDDSYCECHSCKKV